MNNMFKLLFSHLILFGSAIRTDDFEGTTICSFGGSPHVSESGRWVRDDEILNNECMGCLQQFNFLRRIHHCRGCGGAFCHNCAPYREVDRRCGECFKRTRERRSFVAPEFAPQPRSHPAEGDINVEDQASQGSAPIVNQEEQLIMGDWFVACKEGNVQEVQRQLLKLHQDPKAKTVREEKTGLMFACENSKLDVVDIILNPIETLNRRVFEEQQQVLSLPKKERKHVRAQADSWQSAQKKALEYFTHSSVDINSFDVYGDTALSLAVKSSDKDENLEIVKKLINAGAHPTTAMISEADGKEAFAIAALLREKFDSEEFKAQQEQLQREEAERIRKAEEDAQIRANLERLEQERGEHDAEVQRLKRELDSKQDATTCSICMDAVADHMVVTCGHKCLCADCAKTLEKGPASRRKCPICRARIPLFTEDSVVKRGFVKVFD